MYRVGSHGVREVYSISGMRCLLFEYSTSVTPPSCLQSQTHFMVNYLIHSLGFSREEAITASAKVNHLKSVKNPELVLNLFQQCGLDKTQIRNIVYSEPKLLLRNADKTLKPKIRVLQEIGLSGPDLVKLISGNESFFRRGLDTHIAPSIGYLREILGSDDKVVKAIRKSKWLISCNLLKRMQPNVVLLQKSGFPNDKIEKFMINNPRYFMQKPEWLVDIIHRVEGELGIPCKAAMFFHGIDALASVSKSTLEAKCAVFKSFGWSDSDITTMAKNNPFCLSLSEAKIRNGLKFFMKELGYEPAYLASHPKFLGYSMEKRVVPRNNVLKILKEKKLLKTNLCLYSAVCYTELKFVENFVLRYRYEIPDLYQTCINSRGP